MFEKSDVNGYNERPLFTYLKVNFKKKNFYSSYPFEKSLCPSPIEEFHSWPNITYAPMRSEDLRWNFEKVFFMIEYSI
jgi:glutathione peroxidase-family protein